MDSLKALAFIVGYFVIISFIVNYEHKKKSFEIDAKPLSEQTLFRLAIIIPIVSFLYFGAFAWWGKTPVISAHGFKRFIEISTLPLGLLSLTIPFTAVINNMHRTVQTNEQINQTQSKNSIDLYLNHKKSAIEYFEKNLQKEISIEVVKHMFKQIEDTGETIFDLSNTIELKYKLSIKNPYYLYNNMFTTVERPDFPLPTLLSVSNSFFEKLKSKWIEINNIFQKNMNPIEYEEDDEKYKSYIINIQEKIFEILDILYIERSNLKFHSLKSVPNSRNEFRTYIINNVFAKKILRDIYDMTYDIYIFSGIPPIREEDIRSVYNYFTNEYTLIGGEFDSGNILDDKNLLIGSL
ncbi:hypothetical protein M0H77_RS10015 [Providencia rettgeri]|nr:hypothetical protein [Providencia rettgeri]